MQRCPAADDMAEDVVDDMRMAYVICAQFPAWYLTKSLCRCVCNVINRSSATLSAMSSTGKSVKNSGPLYFPFKEQTPPLEIKENEHTPENDYIFLSVK